jgi:hypothetical protein
MKTTQATDVDRSLIEVGAKRRSSLVQIITFLGRVSKETFRNANCRLPYSRVLTEVTFSNIHQETEVSHFNRTRSIICFVEFIFIAFN